MPLTSTDVGPDRATDHARRRRRAGLARPYLSDASMPRSTNRRAVKKTSQQLPAEYTEHHVSNPFNGALSYRISPRSEEPPSGDPSDLSELLIANVPLTCIRASTQQPVAMSDLIGRVREHCRNASVVEVQQTRRQQGEAANSKHCIGTDTRSVIDHIGH